MRLLALNRIFNPAFVLITSDTKLMNMTFDEDITFQLPFKPDYFLIRSDEFSASSASKMG